MMSELIELSFDEGIALITITRPKALNALNFDVLVALDAAISSCEDNEELRCVVVTGAGEKSFVAGADIAQMVDLTASKAAVFSAKGHQVFTRLAALTVPVIAAVNGFCLGGGCELSLACDLVYASEKARFGQPEVTLGLIPGFGGTQRLARRVGAMRATELVSTGRMVGAEEAKSMGLCLEVFKAAELMDSVLKIARTIAKRGPMAVRAAKKVQRLGIEASLAVANAYEQEAFGNLFDTEDAREGMNAFLAKRAAEFKNR
jgi:enoyl-CoA hydratase